MSKRTRIARKEIKKMEAELHSDYAQFMQQMKDYLRFTDVGADQKTLIYHDIVNMLLEGQARGQSVQEIIGEDYRDFCDEVIAAAPHLSRTLKWMALAQQFLVQLFVLLGFWLLMEMVNHFDEWPWTSFTVGSIWFYGGIIALALYSTWHNTKFAFSGAPGRLLGLYIICFLGIIAGNLLLNRFSPQPVVVVHTAALIAFLVVIGLASVILDRAIDARLEQGRKGT